MLNSHVLTVAATLLLARIQATTQPYQIDLTGYSKVQSADLGMGTSLSPTHHRIACDNQCIRLDGTPWLPVAGEFQFSRYPRADWRDELLKMKACGVQVVGCYVFWNHIEEDRGVFDWGGQRSLHDFLKLCQDLGLKAFVRIGPWCHGETRNGGFPDWVVQASKADHFRLRSTDPKYLDLVHPYYRQMAQQMQGQLWKDGGPVIAIQVDNECGDLPYLQSLKKMAIQEGIDVPLYTMTGWAVPVPDSGLIPMFGRYGEAFWLNEGDNETTKSYEINNIRDDGDMGIIGGKVGNTRADRAEKLARFPHFCIETGGGMQSTYARRILMKPDDTGALALCRVASGANLLGYYIFQGAITPDGKHSSLNESTASGYPFDIPIKDYDFNAPITNTGLLRPSYHLLRQLHLFLGDFGKDLAPMPTYFPADQPKSIDDGDTLRWSMRWNGDSGYLFFNNYQQVSSLPAKPNVQFTLKTANGEIRFPQQPITIPSGAYGILPIHQNCSGVDVAYATAQPLCHLEANGAHWYFYKAFEGIKPEFSIDGKTLSNITPGPQLAFTVANPQSQKVNFVVLSPDQAKSLWKFTLKGQDHAILCDNAIMQDSDKQLRVEAVDHPLSTVKIFPPIPTKSADRDGIFQTLNFPPHVAPIPIQLTLVKPGGLDPAIKVNATDEKAWSQAAVWKIPSVPANAVLRIQYQGDVARIYANGKLIADNFYNGAPFDFGTWRIPPSQLHSLELHIMPLAKTDSTKLPTPIRATLPPTPQVATVTQATALPKTTQKIRF